MATSTSVGHINPRGIFLGTFYAAALLFLSSIVIVLFFSRHQNQRLLKFELSVLLRGHGTSLLENNLRTFSQIPRFNGQPWGISIHDSISSVNFSYDSENLGSLKQCVSSDYFQFNVTLCRPNPIPWNYIALISALYFLITGLLFSTLFRANKSLLKSLRSLFQTANLQCPESLSVSKAWAFTHTMAERFKELQIESVEYGRNEALVKIATQVAHDIRSPLSAINLVTSTLTDASIEKRNIIQSATSTINEIANGLLAQYSKQKTEPNFSRRCTSDAQLSDLVRSVVQEKQVLWESSPKIRLHLNLPAKDIWSHINETELKRALSNILNNSFEAIGSEGSVTVTVSNDSSRNVIEVQDDGIGIPENILPMIGDRGISFGKATETAGFGLGLSHAKATVEKGGGRFTIQSTRGRGTTIRMTLPELSAQ